MYVIAEFEEKESNFISAKDVKQLGIKEIKIISEIVNEQTAHGPKAGGMVAFSQGVETIEKSMRFNQTFLNWLIREKGKDSKKWIGLVIKIKTVETMGNLNTIPDI